MAAHGTYVVLGVRHGGHERPEQSWVLRAIGYTTTFTEGEAGC